MIWAALGLLLLAALAVALAPLVVEARRRPVAADRGRAPGAFAQLSQGVTHYQWFGPAQGPVVVCVHGLTTPSFVWAGLIGPLTGMGFRVLVYDLYGRGFSDRPKGAQDSEFFLCQLEDLLEDQEVEDGFSLIGYSMGGAIAAGFAAVLPERLERLILLAPAGMGHDLGGMERLIAGRRGLGNWLMLAGFAKRQRAGVEAERGAPGVEDAIVDEQLAELERRGYIGAVLASLRGILSQPMEAEHREIARSGLPVLAIWGRDDKTIPIAAMGRLTQWNRGARQEVIEGAGHDLTYARAAKVAAIIRDAVA